jgi:hypothetical protein
VRERLFEGFVGAILSMMHEATSERIPLRSASSRHQGADKNSLMPEIICLNPEILNICIFEETVYSLTV